MVFVPYYERQLSIAVIGFNGDIVILDEVSRSRQKQPISAVSSLVPRNWLIVFGSIEWNFVSSQSLLHPWRRKTFPCNLSLFLDNVNTLSEQFAHKVFFTEKTKVIYKIVLCLLSRQYGVQKHNLIRAPKTSFELCYFGVRAKKYIKMRHHNK